ncbi:serine hydrolase domain-containing protein [Falsirhodobacter algicola]|uniref:Serine hydrolase n=1 Tax=Falsirhodobacter algicola TaxID=2692330 RepID=A0A8J8MS28_9RHOB|nr:serine hydrolase domain-containing protein [Falsirhodobacter algicola]QUS35484.1 serine hydrolase [Falsirhodobacter algicola]
MLMHWAAAAERASAIVEEWGRASPGGVILGFDRGGIRLSVAGGVARIGEAAPLSADSPMRWASVTKHVLAETVLRTGVLPLDLPLGEELAELAPAPGSVTVRQALSMQGGLPDTREMLTLLGLGTASVTDKAALLAFSAGIPRLNAEPGTEVAYSNAGYRLVEAALERRGVRFADQVAAQAARLGTGMRAMEYWSDPLPGLVPGHVPCADGWRVGFQGMHISAAGSLAGSATDLAVWLADLMTRPECATLSAPVPLRSGVGTGYGLGISLTTIGARRLPGHGGAQPGYRSGFLLDPKTGAGIVVLCNREDVAATGLAQQLMRVLLGVRDDARPAASLAAPGLYAAPEGNLWAELRSGSITLRDAEEALVMDDGWAVSTPAHALVRLRPAPDGALEGEIGHLPVRLEPATDDGTPSPDGDWHAHGATLRIGAGHALWGRGPQAERAPLVPLGRGRWLFTVHDQGTPRRICLRRLNEDRIELSLSRARVIEYERM